MIQKDNVKKPIKRKRKPKNYLNNADLMKEIALSKEQNKVTDALGKMLMMLVSRYIKVPRFASYTYREDMQGHALRVLMKVWRGFNLEKGDNPFGYFTQILKRAFFQFDNSERAQRDIRDAKLISHGEMPSFSYLERYSPTVDDDVGYNSKKHGKIIIIEDNMSEEERYTYNNPEKKTYAYNKSEKKT